MGKNGYWGVTYGHVERRDSRDLELVGLVCLCGSVNSPAVECAMLSKIWRTQVGEVCYDKIRYR